MRVLLVEDEALTVMYLKHQLKKLELTDVQAVASGEKALALTADWSPDLVLMDIQLAGEMDGIQTTIELRKRVEVPVIYTTSYDNPEVKERAMRSGAADYLIKPISMDLLGGCIERLFPH